MKIIQKLEIDQRILTAVQSANSNLIVYFAPAINNPVEINNRYDGPTQVLYAIMHEKIKDGAGYFETIDAVRKLYMEAAKNRYGSNEKIAQAVGLSERGVRNILSKCGE